MQVASPPMLTKAKDQGYPAQNCQYCQWMVAEKEKQKARTANVDSLKTFPGGKEQR